MYERIRDTAAPAGRQAPPLSFDPQRPKPYMAVDCRMGEHEKCGTARHPSRRQAPGVVYQACECRCHPPAGRPRTGEEDD
ncbi:hypothetical protein GCM10010357_24640 [Streptomyces luteireticuli]|uniref:Uncharacterized protein n=1 Tax=Streptomyces luteireticuli TaxID=173858 RepID=A0ABN0YNK3_9ACTN